MTLAETQRLFHALATRDPATSPDEAARILRGTPGLSAPDRIAIYADMYLWRLVDGLREDYPKVAALLGDERFLALGEAYARAHPSDRADLGLFGRHLPAFLARRPAGDRADLADLAALEWARTEVFLEAPAEPLDAGALSTLRPDEFLAARLDLVPALRVLRLGHEVALAWGRLEEGAPAGAPVPGGHAVAVWRSGFDVFHVAIDPDEAAALEAAAAGEPLERVCAAFAAREAPAAAAFAALSSWLREGWIASLRRPGEGSPGLPFTRPSSSSPRSGA